MNTLVISYKGRDSLDRIMTNFSEEIVPFYRPVCLVGIDEETGIILVERLEPYILIKEEVRA